MQGPFFCVLQIKRLSKSSSFMKFSMPWKGFGYAPDTEANT